MKHSSKISVAGVLIVIILVFSGCKKTEEGVTSYTLINSLISLTGSDYNIDATVYEYDKNDIRVDSNIVPSPTRGKEYKFYPNANADHLKLKMVSDENTVRWGDTIFYLQKGKNVEIKVSLSMISNYCMNEPLPKAGK